MVRALLVPGWVVVLASVSIAGPYVVAPGDTLSGIAQSQLGDAGRWREIAQVNGLVEPYSITVGQKLELPTGPPPPPDTASASTNQAEPSRRRGWVGVTVAVAVTVAWLFVAACLWLGCWFALVDTTIARCSWLSLLLLMLAVMCGGIVIAAVVYVGMRGGNPILIPASAVLASVLFLATKVLMIKQQLACKWRSVLTVIVMANLVGDLLAALTVYGLALVVPGLGAVFGDGIAWITSAVG